MFVRSLAPLTPLTQLTLLTQLNQLTHSAALRLTMLASLIRSIYGLAHSLCSLPRGMIEIHEYVFTLKTSLARMNAFLYSLETRHYICDLIAFRRFSDPKE